MWTSLATCEISLAMSIPLAPSPTTTTLCAARVYQTGNSQVLQPARNKRQRKGKHLIAKWFWNAIVVAVHLLPQPLVDSCNARALLDISFSYVILLLLGEKKNGREQMVPRIWGTRGTVQWPLQTTTAASGKLAMAEVDGRGPSTRRGASCEPRAITSPESRALGGGAGVTSRKLPKVNRALNFLLRR